MNAPLRTLAATAAVAAGMVMLPFGAHAAKAVEIEIDAPPPPPPFDLEGPPPPRPGYVIEPGHYEWDGSRYVWREYRYLKEREGRRYEPPVIEKRGERWHYRSGHWDDED
jgi:hypothetical protein